MFFSVLTTDPKKDTTDQPAVQESPLGSPVVAEHEYESCNPVDGETGYATIPESAYENTGRQYEEPAAVVKKPAVYEKLHMNQAGKNE